MPLQHITNAEVIAAGVVSAPNVLNGTPQQNKTIFDNLVASVVVPAYNLCVDAVNALEVLGEHEREAEALREAAERLREQAEQGRVSAEELRAAAEMLRERAEQARATAEGTRSNAEAARVQAEAARAAAETERRQHETARAEAETARGTAETQRRAAEQARERYVTELRQAVEAGEFDGHTPEKGVDYWTSADKQELAEEAAGFMPKEIFYAAYNTTTLAEIWDAYRAGKLCCCKYGGVSCWLDGSSSLTEEAFFAGIADGGGSGKAKILCISMADVEGSSAWMNWTLDISTDREKVFRAEVFETSYDELMTAYRAGKLCVCRYLNRDYILQDMPAGYMGHATFIAPMSDGIKMLYLWAGTRDWEPVDIPYPGGGGGDDKMDKSNPTGTGSFSLNRRPGTTVGNYSFAEGYNTTASGYYSHAEGADTTASNDLSHAEGEETTASGHASHAEGRGTTASGTYSHAEGRSTITRGDSSHAEGAGTTASGHYSHAEGEVTIASSNCSHAEGYSTKASSMYQHAQGVFNVEDTDGLYADIVGWGTADNARKNISSLTTGGDLHLAGDVYVGANDDGTGGTKLGKGGGGANSVFVVEYGVTPFADIKAAHLANKVCVIFDGNRTYHLVSCSNAIAQFLFTATNGNNKMIAVAITDVWTEIAAPLVLEAAISTEISADSTDNQVASAKAVYDAISTAITDIDTLIGSGVIE